MEINLETIHDIRTFRNQWKTIYNKNKAVGTIANAKVVISAKLLSDFFTEEEKHSDKLYTELTLLKYNFVKEWIEENIETNNESSAEVKQTESEVIESCISEVKEELASFKAEEDLTSVNMIDLKYNFLYMIQDIYNLTPEEIIKKVEKDLAELEVPVNAVEEAVKLESK